MLVKTIAELNMARESGLYTLLEFIGNPITAMFIAVFVAYYALGIRQHMSMGTMLTHTENGFGSIANILLIIGAGGAFNAILKSSSLADTLAVILSNTDMHRISGLVSGSYLACCSGFRHRGNDGGNGNCCNHAAAVSRHQPGKLLRSLSVQVRLAARSLRTAFLAGEAILRC